jgi:tetratricopeptide (TPR) repeat protein
VYFFSQWRSWTRRCLRRLKRPLIAALLALGVAVGEVSAAGQTHGAIHKDAAPRKPIDSASPALAELQKRSAALQKARESGDPQAVTQASRALVAVALRQMAHLRLVEGAFPAAIDLYQSSLGFEDNPATRVDLAIAYLRAKKPTDSLTQASAAILAAPDDPRGWRIQGTAYMVKQQYAPAAESLQRSLALHDDLEVAYSLGICWLATHQKEKALAVFKKMDEEAANR